MNDQRFTRDGSDELEGHLAHTCDRVLARILALVPPGTLEAMLLGGGYGRGEGGVLRGPGDKPYNDLEFYLLLRGCCFLNERRYRRALMKIEEELSPDAGLEVEFKVLSRRKLERSPVLMGYYDLVAGHRQIWGDRKVLSDCGHHYYPENIPLCEATRLLMNRCSGLLFSMARLRKSNFTDEDADFVGRNHAKAQLAFGDVVLTAFGKYHWSCLERAGRLKELSIPGAASWMRQIQKMHETGVSFKLHPQQSTGRADDFIEQQCLLTEVGLSLWLWLESRRLNRNFSTPVQYVLDPIDKCAGTSWAKNALNNTWNFGLSAWWDGKTFRYPREKLLDSLAVLLWAPETVRERGLLRLVRRNLHTHASSWPELVEAYTTLWRRFN